MSPTRRKVLPASSDESRTGTRRDLPSRSCRKLTSYFAVTKSTVAEKCSVLVHKTALPPRGLFGLISYQTLQKLLDYCTLSDLGRLAQSSHVIHADVISYTERNRVMKKHLRDIGDKFRGIGYFLKRVTCLQPTAQRIHLCSQLYLLYGPHDIVQRHDITKSWGALFHALMHGWQAHECDHVYTSMLEFAGTQECITNFINSTPGSRLADEDMLRTFYRCFFLKQPSVLKHKEEHIYWLRKILDGHASLNVIARILFLALAPTQPNGSVDWDTWMAFLSPLDARDARRWFADLAFAFERMLDARNHMFLEEDVLALLHELTMHVIEPWNTTNIALLFLNCASNRLACKWAMKRVDEGQTEFVAAVVHEMILATEHYGGLKQLDFVHSIVRYVLAYLKGEATKGAFFAQLVGGQQLEMGVLIEDADPEIECVMSGFTLWLQEYLAQSAMIGEI